MIRTVSEKSRKLIKQQFTASSVDKIIAVILIALTVGILGMVLILRPHTTPIGDETYLFLRQAKAQYTMEDQLSFSGRIHSFNILPQIIRWLSLNGSVQVGIIANLLMIVLGALTTLTFFSIVKTLKRTRTIAFLATIIFVLSPAFTYLFVTVNKNAFPLLLLLISMDRMLKENTRRANLALIATAAFGIIPAIVSLLSIAIYVLLKKEKKLWLAGVIIGTVIVIQMALARTSHIIQDTPIRFVQTLQTMLADMGGIFGLNIFAIILAIFGFVYLWKEKYKHSIIYITIIVFSITSIFIKDALFYLTPLIAALAALGIEEILKIRWEIRLIENLTLLVLITGLLFSSFSHVKALTVAQPTDEIKESLEFLKEQSNQSAVVFSDITKGNWISAIAERKNVWDSNTELVRDIKERNIDFKNLTATRKIKEADKVIEKYGITHIWIDANMKKKLWKNEEDGLLFLLTYGKDFKKIYESENTQILEIER